LTKLTCSVGVGCNGGLAKIGANVNKPHGMFAVPPDADAIVEFMKTLPLNKVNGIGKVMQSYVSYNYRLLFLLVLVDYCCYR
jgi:DNA polymerase kappa